MQRRASGPTKSIMEGATQAAPDAFGFSITLRRSRAALAAFVIVGLLVRVVKAPNALVALVFVALIVGGLAITLGRELRGRPRQR